MGGKKGGSSSWLTAVKRAFRSPTKINQDNQPDDDEEKKREKRRWLFRKQPATSCSSTHENATTQQTNNALPSDAEQRHAVAVAQAAAMGVARLAKPPPPVSNVYGSRREHVAAIVIQTAFRGYLARRALGALKGLVKLQALVRGENVRKQAKLTLQCMQALVRVQSRILDQRMRQSHEATRNSTFSDTNTNTIYGQFQDFSDRRSSMSRDGGSSSIPDDWDERSHTIEEVKAMLHSRKEAALRRQRNSSSHHAFPQQVWRGHGARNASMGSEDEFGAAKPWERASTDHTVDYVKTVEIDATSQPYSYLPPHNLRRSSNQQQQHQLPSRPNSPLHNRSHQQNQSFRSPSKTTRPIHQVRSASPRSSREETTYNHSAQAPTVRPNNHINYYSHYNGGSSSASSGTVQQLPNYMAATESAKARIRSQSAPRQRPSTPERERIGSSSSSAKKRLSFPVPVPEAYYGMGYLNNLRSPSFKSVVSAFGYEHQSNYSSCCGTDSLGGGEVSPCTTDLRRWLR